MELSLNRYNPQPTTVVVSAPGKIHLMGEHAVVYGRPAVLIAINRRIVVKCQVSAIGEKEWQNRHSGKRRQERVQNLKEDSSRSWTSQDDDNDMKNAIRIQSQENDHLIRRAVDVFQNAYKIRELPPLEITVTSELSTGSGMGSSAAVAAATIGALMKTVKGLWHPVRIHELAYEVEKSAHGNPSGADVTAVVYGGLVWFRKEFEFLKSIWTLPLSHYTIPPFVLIDTGKPKETTKEMIEIVAMKRLNNRAAVEGNFSDQEHQAKRLVLAMRSEDMKGLVAAMTQGERNLEQLGLVGQKAQDIVKDIESVGGSAKISGAGGLQGGSGMLLCYHADVNTIETIAKKHGVSTMNVEVSEEGVRIDKQ